MFAVSDDMAIATVGIWDHNVSSRPCTAVGLRRLCNRWSSDLSVLSAISLSLSKALNHIVHGI